MSDGVPANGNDGFSRREFMYRVAASVPTISFVANSAGSAAEDNEQASVAASSKFTPVDLSAHFNASSRDFGPRARAKAYMGGEVATDGLTRMLTGKRLLQGMPFWLGPEGVDRKAWIALSTRPRNWTVPRVEIDLGRKAHFLCVASFCDWDPNESPPPGSLAFEKLGEELGRCVFRYSDGRERALPIRRRFETNTPREPWGHLCAAAVPALKHYPRDLHEPIASATDWGGVQTLVGYQGSGGKGIGYLWLCALQNPMPDETLQSVRFEAAAADPLMVAGLTLYHWPQFPFRHERTAVYRITLPEADPDAARRWKVSADLGEVLRTYVLPPFPHAEWLASPSAGLGSAAAPVASARYLYMEVTASAGATLALQDSKTSRKFEFDLGQAKRGQELAARPGGSRIELLVREKQWVHGRVLDSVTHQPTPARLAFRSKEGRYIPPYGHRDQINTGWFQDYGADVMLMDMPFAYVDGTFQVELPVGEVYLEMTKGFEYHPVRQKLEIAPGQRELAVEMPRYADLRSKGWVTADTHTHFLSPSTALLEAQAEGLNLINLLAAQWGQLFTNVGDLAHGPLLSKDRESMVWVGSENRQHLLGHLALLGVHGEPVLPMSLAGPDEAYMGDPLWNSLAEWADACRKRQGLAVCAHFPYPTGEIAADIILGKIDALEIWPQDPVDVEQKPTEQFNTLHYLDWYHFLNCGYRLPAVAGTDKMGAYMPAGTNRCYAYIGQEEFNFANWARGVRTGNAFVTSGPLLLFHADGRAPGSEITFGAGGGTVEVRADVQSFVPFHKVEVIFNGRVVASREDASGVRSMTLSERVKVPGPGWLAARCSSNLGPVTSWHYKIAAHTSPVYIKVTGTELFSPDSAAYFLKMIDFAETYVETLAIRPNPDEYAKIRAIYHQAREALHRRMHQHGIPH
ncbi:MAG TPA: CehA/McbA family metallohydrolase [Terriglobia bacterium]|nr:CehA/McbA family metallohydrolase [Terriglobia bacterium]